MSYTQYLWQVGALEYRQLGAVTLSTLSRVTEQGLDAVQFEKDVKDMVEEEDAESV